MSGRAGQQSPDYLIVGHITQDKHEAGYRLGGSVVYSGVLAHRMGLNVAVYTSGAAHLTLDFLDGMQIIDQPSPVTTKFINSYTPSGRTQQLIERAEELDCSQIPDNWKQAEIIHLAPVAREVPITAQQEFPAGFLAYSLQGWLRDWNEEGVIFPSSLPEGSELIGENAIGLLSIEDLGYDRSGLEELQRHFPTLVMTLGFRGVEIMKNGSSTIIPTPSTTEIDPTGAGDIFAAALVILWKIKGMGLAQSAQAASKLAAASVKKSGLASIPESWEINEIIGVQG
jgi:sugar/nucleoside kinase (ribokinase family)